MYFFLVKELSQEETSLTSLKDDQSEEIQLIGNGNATFVQSQKSENEEEVPELDFEYCSTQRNKNKNSFLEVNVFNNNHDRRLTGKIM